MHTVAYGCLPNGLRLVTVQRPHLHRVVISAYIHVGSRHETPATNGISHFVEHMMFRGTQRRPSAAAFNDGIESLGGDLTAATHGDFTLFELTVPPESLEQGCAELGEVFATPVFADRDTEKGIVLEEILEDRDEDGVDIHPDNVCRAQVFGRHALGLPITGHEGNVKKFTERHLRAHVGRYYAGRNMAVSIVGPVTHKAMSRAIERGFGGLVAGAPHASRPFVPRQARARVKVVRCASARTAVRLAFPTPGQRSPSARAIELLLRVLDDGMSTRLHRRICDERGLAYEVSAGVELFDDAGILDVSSILAHATVPSLVSEVLTILGDLALDGPTQTEVDKARRRCVFDFDALEDDAQALSYFYGTSELFNLRQSLAERRASVRALTPVDLRRAARWMFTPNRLNLSFVGQISVAARQEIDRIVRRFRERMVAGVRTASAPARTLSRPGVARSDARTSTLDLFAALP